MRADSVPIVIEELYASIATDDYLGDLAGYPLPELRAKRTECQRVEDAVSYQRRLVQGRLDILQAERDRRAAGEPPADLETLVANLPGALAAGVAGPRRGHATYEHELADVESVTAAVDEACPPSVLAALPDTPGDELDRIADRLRQLEQEVSSRRRTLFDRLDALADELGRRYREGEASVDKLLS